MINQPYRLEDSNCIDRSSPVTFFFDGKRLTGFKGDTLASALLANGIRLVGRSFKYHRRRGIYSAGLEEPNAFVTLRAGGRHEPNVPATNIELYDGLTAISQNRWPSLGFDLLGITGLFSKFLSAGFYYKTFMGPTRKSWLLYEHFIRKAAGMGRAPDREDPDKYEKVFAFCDVLIVGAGPAGIMAALEAGRSGARVILAEDDFELGGSLLSRTGDHKSHWLRRAVTELESKSNIRIMQRTTVFGAYDSMTFGLVERAEEHQAKPAQYQPRQRYIEVNTKTAIIATGMIERPLVFGNNDLPGIMLASAAQTYLNRYGVLPGKKVIAFANNNSIYGVALDLAKAGTDVSVVDVRASIPDNIRQSVAEAGITLHLGKVVSTANGKNCVKSVDVAMFDAEASVSTGPVTRITCDTLLLSGGWTPTLHLVSQRGYKPHYDEKYATLVAGEIPAGFFLAGGVSMAYNFSQCLQSGIESARQAVTACGLSPESSDHQQAGDFADDDIELDVEALWEVPDPANGKPKMKFVDLQNDVKVDDINLAYREGYDSVELLKRYTTLGMSPDQGKTSNLNGLAILANNHNKPINEVGTTIFRPPYRSIPIGVLAGQSTGLHFRPIRRSPFHVLHEKNRAVFTQTGLWLRPWYFPMPGEDCASASLREAENVRNNVGLVDISSLGKIDVQGPDVAEFLNRVYVNNWDSLQPGKGRYGVMLRMDGIVMDDGTTSRLTDDHYFMTTTTAGAGKVMSHLEYLLQVAWPELKVHVTSVTSQWAALAIAGPNSRALLSKVVSDVDFNNDSFPFMGVVHGKINEVRVRLMRVSFSGELAYEVYIPAAYGQPVWQYIQDTGKDFDLTLYGTEALGILRIEKGHFAGPEIDGRTSLVDVGLGRMASNKKSFIGSALRQRDGIASSDRPTLVGLESIDGVKLRAGAILCEQGKHSGHGIGFISSATYSPALKKHIALGFVSGGMQKDGQKIDAIFPLKNEVSAVRVTSPHFYDPQGSRLHV